MKTQANMIQEILCAMDPIGIVTQAYDKDFRWWFLALLMLVIGAGLWAFRYLLNRADAEQKTHELHVANLVKELSNSRDNYHLRIDALQANTFTLVREVSGVISACNKIIEGSTRESEKTRQVIERLEWQASPKRRPKQPVPSV